MLPYIFCISSMVFDVFSDLDNLKFYPQQPHLLKNETLSLRLVRDLCTDT